MIQGRRTDEVCTPAGGYPFKPVRLTAVGRDDTIGKDNAFVRTGICTRSFVAVGEDDAVICVAVGEDDAVGSDRAADSRHCFVPCLWCSLLGPSWALLFTMQYVCQHRGGRGRLS